MCHAFTVSHLLLMRHAIIVSTMCDPSHPAMLFTIPVSTMCYPTSAADLPLMCHTITVSMMCYAICH